MSQVEGNNFVTVVSVGVEDKTQGLKNLSNHTTPDSEPNSSAYVTVLTIGDKGNNPQQKTPINAIVEEVFVYRLPGERLGFGLKFEGGSKASEFVKRLYIQSCAPDSPASRVTSSWGSLAEGDEVLEIDCIPVNNMTRIDCVRCLKDSNVVIKLLVQHVLDSSENKRTKSLEDLPLVISAEKKRQPPPPPPVPPRKIPRKLFKHHSLNGKKDLPEKGPVPNARRNSSASSLTESKAKAARGSPEMPRRDRRFSDGSLGPPDAEVYVDLFSQESTLSLSESDDTGSTISTVVDRFGSFPTTTTSSFAGSLPSTPTAVQRQLDLTNLLSAYEDDEIILVNKNVIQPLKNEIESDKLLTNGGDEGSTLQPPSYFQDAPLSYGNEDMRIVDQVDCVDNKPCVGVGSNSRKTDGSASNKIDESGKLAKKPPVPPRARDISPFFDTKKDISKEIHDENMNISSNLPRLVDFVPKPVGGTSTKNTIKVMQLFLEIERREHFDHQGIPPPLPPPLPPNSCFCEDLEDMDIYNAANGIDMYNSKWRLSPQLATIGEVEEENCHEFHYNRSVKKSTTPIVIVENADGDSSESTKSQNANETTTTPNRKDITSTMDVPPSDPRQPPDGHEFPDYEETNSDSPTMNNKDLHYIPSVVPAAAPPPKPSTDSFTTNKMFDSMECINLSHSQRHSSLDAIASITKSHPNIQPQDMEPPATNTYTRTKYETTDDINCSNLKPTSNLHHRSQSLIDMSALSKQKHDKWQTMVEQRKRSMSKLKGLIIPEHVSESEPIEPHLINLPEIKSQNTVDFVPSKSTSSFHPVPPTSPPDKPVLNTIPWFNTETTSISIPKYSPAFKRKSLQVFPTTSPPPKPTLSDDFRLENLSDSPKSLESITSPTRSDCSFDYATNNKKCPSKSTKKDQPVNGIKSRYEDESDNDSALSSSQSSYISRSSPPPSPTNDYDMYQPKLEEDKYNSRLLKPTSVEAINRKNILASAKCRSGRDLKVGSPVIRRKYESDESEDKVDGNLEQEQEKPPTPPLPEEEILDKLVTPNNEELLVEVQPEPTIVAFEETEPTKPPVMSSRRSPSPTKIAPPRVRECTKNETIPVSTPKEITRSEYLGRYKKEQKSPSVNALKKNFEKMTLEASSSTTTTAPKPKSTQTSELVNQIERSNRKSDPEPIKLRKTSLTKKIEEVPPKIRAEREPRVSNTTPIKENGLNEPREVNSKGQVTVVLNVETAGSSLGITLAGGTDYEQKDVSIYHIRSGSIAYRDNRLKRGDKVISINDCLVAGLTHYETVNLLKKPVTKFRIVVEGKPEVPSNSTTTRRSIPSPKPTINKVSGSTPTTPDKTATHVISLMKNSAGLGFSIEGGKDSPNGDVPLTVRKVFQGGAAEKSGELQVGDEILAIDEVLFVNRTRIEAWNLMKNLPDQTVKIQIYRKST